METTERYGEKPEYVQFDMNHLETWGTALKDVDRLFLLLPPTVGVTPVQAFIDAARRVGIQYVTYLSTLGAEKFPILPHRRVEKYLAQTGMRWTFFRASYFMQNLSEIHLAEIVEDYIDVFQSH